MNLWKKLGRSAALLAAAAAVSVLMAVPAFAAVGGDLEFVDGKTLNGWAWDSDAPDTVQEVKIYAYPDGSETPFHLGTLKADLYRKELDGKAGSGYHGFSCAMEWDRYKGESFRLEAAVVIDGEEYRIDDAIYYDKTGNEGEVGPGVSGEAKPAPAASGKKGESLGTFKTTAYCPCSSCSGGYGKTYSGTVPQANHTISADLDLYPIGTKLMIGDTIYTVEDKGSSVNGNKLDIFFSTHSEALSYGTKNVEVFAVTE